MSRQGGPPGWLLGKGHLIQRRQGGNCVHSLLAQTRKLERDGRDRRFRISSTSSLKLAGALKGTLRGFFYLFSATRTGWTTNAACWRSSSAKVDGLIVEGTKAPCPPQLPLYEKLREMDIPVVFFNGYYPTLLGKRIRDHRRPAKALTRWVPGGPGARLEDRHL